MDRCQKHRAASDRIMPTPQMRINLTAFGLASRVFDALRPGYARYYEGAYWALEYEFPVYSAWEVYEVVYSVLVNAGLAPETLVCALKYINDFVYRAGIQLNFLTWYRTLVAALLVSAKMHEDGVQYIQRFSQATADLDVEGLKTLEALFCGVLDFHFFLSDYDYDLNYKAVTRAWQLAEREISIRNAAVVSGSENAGGVASDAIEVGVVNPANQASGANPIMPNQTNAMAATYSSTVITIPIAASLEDDQAQLKTQYNAQQSTTPQGGFYREIIE